jgi:hypothetical protein
MHLELARPEVAGAREEGKETEERRRREEEARGI